MSNYKTSRRVLIEDSQLHKYDDLEENDDDAEGEKRMRRRRSGSNVSEDQEPFMGMKVRRKASLHRDFKGDYLDVPSLPYLMKILQKQGQSVSFHLITYGCPWSLIYFINYQFGLVFWSTTT